MRRTLPVGARERSVTPLPKVPTGRHLASSGLEFLIYTVGIILLLKLSVLTLGLAGIIGPLFASLVLAVRDLRGGMYSVGKRIAGLRVVDARTGLAATGRQALLRNSYYILLFLIMALPLVEFVGVGFFPVLMFMDAVTVFVSPAGRRLGDLLARTQVVAEVRR